MDASNFFRNDGGILGKEITIVSVEIKLGEVTDISRTRSRCESRSIVTAISENRRENTVAKLNTEILTTLSRERAFDSYTSQT